MSFYRLYFMETFSGHIERFEEFDVADDAAATALAQASQGPLSLELWCSHRKVARFDALDLTSQLLAQRAAQKAVKAQVEAGAKVDDDTTAENRSA